jgi:DNA-binding transcriptional LysR family regulator
MYRSLSTIPDPDLLYAFVAVVECGSFTSAARRVHRTQPAVSLKVRRLEEMLGRRLFDRSLRPFRLTAHGEVFFDHARRILRGYQDAIAAFDDTPLEGAITLGMPDDYATNFLSPILAKFMRAHPAVHLNVICDSSHRLASRIAEGSMDVALLTGGMSSGIVVHREKLVWVTSVNHEVYKQDPVPLAVFQSSDVFRRLAVEHLEKLGRRARIVITSPSFAGISAALEAGIAVAAVFRSSVRSSLRVLKLREGFPVLPEARIVLQRTNHEPNAITDGLVQCIVSHFGKRRSHSNLGPG